MRRALIASLLSSIALTAAAAPGKPANDAATTSVSVRPVSTGVTPPELIYSNKIQISETELPSQFSASTRVLLKFTLDQTGTPQNIHVVEPTNPTVDARVVQAVRQFRWSPAVLNNHTIPVEMNLMVQVQR